MEQVRKRLPEARPRLLDTGCCGMAGAFGYGVDTYDVSVKMAELDLLPAIRSSTPETLIVGLRESGGVEGE